MSECIHELVCKIEKYLISLRGEQVSQFSKVKLALFSAKRNRIQFDVIVFNHKNILSIKYTL